MTQVQPLNTASLLIHCLESHGVKYIFGVPGEENLDVLEAIRTSSITFVTTRHEQTAGFMAATYGRLTGNAGVCLSTLGPGATNLVTAVAYAQLGGMPMIVITGQKPVKLAKQGNFQIIDVVKMMTPITKMSRSIIAPATVPALINQAFHLAEEEHPGVVHIELAEDIAKDNAQGLMPLTANHIRRPSADPKSISQASDLISESTKPLVLIGAGANRKRASHALTEFVNKTKIPFFTTQMGKGVIDERSPYFLGTAALSDKDYLHCAIDQADLIINVGHNSIEKPPFLMSANSEKKVIHLNFTPATITDVYFPQLEVIGDISNAIEALTQALPLSPSWNFDYFHKVRTQVQKHIAMHAGKNSFPINPEFLVQSIREVLEPQDIVCLDNGMYKLWFARGYPTYESNTLLLDNALASMGAGLPSAMTAKLLNPDKRVIAVTGDGGLLMNLGDLETAVRLNLNLTIVVIVDNQYGMIAWKQQGMGLTDFGLQFSNPDFVQLAASFHAHGYLVDSATSLQSLLDQTAQQPGVQLIAVPIDYTDNYKILTEELNTKSCEI